MTVARRPPNRVGAVRRLTLLAVAGTILLLLVLAQIFLPGIAAQRLRERLSRSGRVLKVEVDAFPAIKLLWHHADRVVVRVAGYRASPGGLGDQLQQAVHVGEIDASVTELDTGLVKLHDATLRKRGNQLSGSARVTEAELRAALPILEGVTPIASADGTLTLRGTATLFGLTATVDATVRADNGRMTVTPDVPFGGFATLILFEHPHIQVEGVGATRTPDGFEVTARARLG
jgi:hypothetical protein